MVELDLSTYTLQSPDTGHGSCRISRSFMTGWCNWRPKLGFTFARFGFAYVSGFR